MGLPHAVYFQVYTIKDTSVVYPDTVSFEAWITDREDEVLTEKSFGCGFYKNHSLVAVQVGNFPTPWKEGELLNIQVKTPIGNAFRTIELTNDSSQYFVKGYMNDNGLLLKSTKSLKEYVKISPNPFKNYLSIEYHLNEDSKIIIKDCNENIVFDSVLRSDKNSLHINTEKYKSGVYTLLIKSKTYNLRKKIIKLN